MESKEHSEIFLATVPGLEPLLKTEARKQGFAGPMQVVPGGVTLQGGWPEAWRANLSLAHRDPGVDPHRRLPRAAPGAA